MAESDERRFKAIEPRVKQLIHGDPRFEVFGIVRGFCPRALICGGRGSW